MSGAKKKPGRPTLRGVPDDPTSSARRGDEPSEGVAQFDSDDKTALSPPPFVEVELSYERGHHGMPTDSWRAVEVWTRNRIYVCDWKMRCIEVVDRQSGKPDATHALLGAFLAGGQRQDSDSMEMTYPLPRPDTEAVFEYNDPRKGYVSTSTVTRVVVRLRVLTVPRANARPTWEHLTSSLKLPPPRKP